MRLAATKRKIPHGVVWCMIPCLCCLGEPNQTRPAGTGIVCVRFDSMMMMDQASHDHSKAATTTTTRTVLLLLLLLLRYTTTIHYSIVDIYCTF